jgi:hypothetical protein
MTEENKTDPWAQLRHTPTGEPVAVDEVTLFMNNATALYAWGFIDPDKGVKENVKSLVENGGFQEEFAQAVVRNFRRNGQL